MGSIGFGFPAVDLPAYAALSGTVIVVAVAATVVPAVRTVRSATRIAH